MAANESLNRLTSITQQYFDFYLNEATSTLEGLSKVSSLMAEVSNEIVERLLNHDATVYWLGNGGSASDAEHLAAELSGRFEMDRQPLRSFSLTSNTSTLTAISNDYGFDMLFARQIEGSVRAEDVVIGISTSGKSRNVIQGLKKASDKKCMTVALTGSYTEELKFVDYLISVDSYKTCHIQESHITIGQAICGAIERSLFGLKP